MYSVCVIGRVAGSNIVVDVLVLLDWKWSFMGGARNPLAAELWAVLSLGGRLFPAALDYRHTDSLCDND